MIISYKHKFIFIHCRRVAGTSIETLLSRFLGHNDILIGNWPSCYQSGVIPNKRFFLDLLNKRSFFNIAKEVLSKPTRILTLQRFMVLLNSIHQQQYLKYFSSPCHPTAIEIKQFDSNA